MHDVLDTDDVDADAERFWPEEFKKTIREGIAPRIGERLREGESFKSAYEALYTRRFSTYDTFVDRLAEMVVIGVENGVDDALGEAHATFSEGAPLPHARPYARHFWPEPVDASLRDELAKAAFEEFRESHEYEHVYEDYFEQTMSLDDFAEGLAGLVVSGAVNGADNMLGNLYRAFMDSAPLPPARRYPRRLR